MNDHELKKRSQIQKIGIKKRFPQLPDDIIAQVGQDCI